MFNRFRNVCIVVFVVYFLLFIFCLLRYARALFCFQCCSVTGSLSTEQPLSQLFRAIPFSLKSKIQQYIVCACVYVESERLLVCVSRARCLQCSNDYNKMSKREIKKKETTTATTTPETYFTISMYEIFILVLFVGRVSFVW